MTLRHYRIFVAVCDAMSMTAAAETLFISQSAVSQAISELEGHYNVRLFERLSRRLYLTKAGQKLLGYARHMIRMNLEVENDMQALSENGTVRIGASVTVGTHVLPGLVLRFGRENPAVRVEVTEDNTAKVEELLLKDAIDFGLAEGEIRSADLISRAFMEDELVLICAPDHPLAACPEVLPHALMREDFIIRESGSGTRKTFEERMNENGLPWKASWVCSNTDTIKNAVAAGLGISVISRLAVGGEAEAGILYAKHVKGMTLTREFKMVFHKNKYITEPMARFMKLLSLPG